MGMTFVPCLWGLGRDVRKSVIICTFTTATILHLFKTSAEVALNVQGGISTLACFLEDQIRDKDVLDQTLHSAQSWIFW